MNLIDKAAVPDHELLVGGFPCQPFSRASTGAKGMDDPKKGTLWKQIYETLKAMRAGELAARRWRPMRRHGEDRIAAGRRNGDWVGEYGSGSFCFPVADLLVAKARALRASRRSVGTSPRELARFMASGNPFRSHFSIEGTLGREWVYVEVDEDKGLYALDGDLYRGYADLVRAVAGLRGGTCG